MAVDGAGSISFHGKRDDTAGCRQQRVEKDGPKPQQ